MDQADPWKTEQYCGMKGYLPCFSRMMLDKEKEDTAITMMSGEKVVEKDPPKETCKTLPACNTEGVVYALDCQTCRKEGNIREYVGESSCSGFQRGQEHKRNIDKGVVAHPVVQPFWEEHKGQRQEVIMRIRSRHIRALSRQVEEYVLIEKLSGVAENCLNNKSEWAETKIPGLRVLSPNGTIFRKEWDGEVRAPEHLEMLREALRRGCKRLTNPTDDDGNLEDEY